MKHHFCTAVFTRTEALQLHRARAAPALQVEEPIGTQAPRLTEGREEGAGCFPVRSACLSAPHLLPPDTSLQQEDGSARPCPQGAAFHGALRVAAAGRVPTPPAAAPAPHLTRPAAAAEIPLPNPGEIKVPVSLSRTSPPQEAAEAAGASPGPLTVRRSTHPNIVLETL